MHSAKIWAEKVNIPTYGVGDMEKNPMFFEKRVYQGSTGKVYPYPVIDKIDDEKKDQEYLIVFLENEYIQVQVMPEVGGRIYRALDKTNNYDFVYYNQVMKPALVGLTGPWVSGGIEFNWPQHHRPNTFGPVEYQIDDSDPKKKTIWLSERDRMYGTKVTTGITLRAGVARIEITSDLYNPTGEAQTFLWWANPAVAVHDETQSIFPPDVHAVMDHGKRDVSRFPIATGTYYKMDYSSGVDISRYKNIPVPTSYMAYHSDYDFVGGYDWRAKAGILHVADHHVSPGKKQWTWGNGEFGRAWDRNLTDEDGPYIELMTGVFTDNQPDFTWLAPYSSKQFTQFFMPYKEVGEVKCASQDIMACLAVEDGKAHIKAYASRKLPKATITLSSPQGLLIEETVALSPTDIYSNILPTNCQEHELTLEIVAEGAKGISYTPPAKELYKLPSPAKAIGMPSALDNNEALLLAGLHLEQYRHATFEPDGYYQEGLVRDPGDLRINNAYGNLLLKRGQFAQALACFEKAKETATRHSPNPYDGEVFFNLGKVFEYMSEDVKAYDAYYKACWSDGWKTQGYGKLAQLSAKRGEYRQAATFAQEALYTGAKNMKARAALVASLRMLGEKEKSGQILAETLCFDPMDFFALREQALLEPLTGSSTYPSLLRGDAHNHMTLAQTYGELGLYTDAVAVMDEYLSGTQAPYAMALYMKAFYLSLQPGTDAAMAWNKAASANIDYCFPNMLDEYVALQKAIVLNPQDANAHYLLGCYLYDKRRHQDAAAMWEVAATLNPGFPTVHRNLSLYYANKEKDFAKAQGALEKAFALNPQDARIFYELCDLYKKMGMPLEEQKEIMEQNRALVNQRDDLTVAYTEVLNACGKYQDALDIILGRNFHPWEGGEGKVPTQHIAARMGIARSLMKAGDPQGAITHLEKATEYGLNFGEGKLTGAQENNIYYAMGLAYTALQDAESAKACFEKASIGLSEPTGAMYYNDQPPHMIFYQGLALQALGRDKEARSHFHKLVDYGEKHVFEPQSMDYFAVSMPDFMVFETDLDEKNKTHCYYMMGLGYMGLSDKAAAKGAFKKALSITPNHLGVMEHLALLDE